MLPPHRYPDQHSGWKRLLQPEGLRQADMEQSPPAGAGWPGNLSKKSPLLHKPLSFPTAQSSLPDGTEARRQESARWRPLRTEGILGDRAAWARPGDHFWRASSVWLRCRVVGRRVREQWEIRLEKERQDTRQTLGS